MCSCRFFFASMTMRAALLVTQLSASTPQSGADRPRILWHCPNLHLSYQSIFGTPPKEEEHSLGGTPSRPTSWHAAARASGSESATVRKQAARKMIV